MPEFLKKWLESLNLEQSKELFEYLDKTQMAELIVLAILGKKIKEQDLTYFVNHIEGGDEV